MKKNIIGVNLLLMISIFLGCSSSSSPYPSDMQLITEFKKHEQLFSKLILDPENQELLTSIKIDRVMVRSSKPKLVLYETWFKDLFGPGGCTKGYAYSEKELDCVESIDDSITDACGPEEKRLYRRLKGKWYLFYTASN